MSFLGGPFSVVFARKSETINYSHVTNVILFYWCYQILTANYCFLGFMQIMLEPFLNIIEKTVAVVHHKIVSSFVM